MHARQAMCESDVFGEDIEKILPIIDQDGSDSSMFDNTLGIFIAIWPFDCHMLAMMMIPEPWENDETYEMKRKKLFTNFIATLMEPWDGPAAIVFTDGKQIGASLDRNGLRPARYYVTKDDYIVMSSEVGVLDIEPENIVYKERLHPGQMLLVDTVEGRIIPDEEMKHHIASEHPYGEWLEEHLIQLEDC